MSFVRINGVLLHYRLVGPAGAPVVALVNSLGTDARIWDGVIAQLSSRYRVLSYDKRGHGLSDPPPGGAPLWAGSPALLRRGGTGSAQAPRRCWRAGAARVSSRSGPATWLARAICLCAATPPATPRPVRRCATPI